MESVKEKKKNWLKLPGKDTLTPDFIVAEKSRNHVKRQEFLAVVVCEFVLSVSSFGLRENSCKACTWTKMFEAASWFFRAKTKMISRLSKMVVQPAFSASCLCYNILFIGWTFRRVALGSRSSDARPFFVTCELDLYMIVCWFFFRWIFNETIFRILLYYVSSNKNAFSGVVVIIKRICFGHHLALN